METQPGTRTTLVDPFGLELEEWLRDTPRTRTPYVSDLVVPPVTGPIERPVDPAAAEVAGEPSGAAPASDTAFRRDRGRHASVCAPSFPEPPERLSLSFGELAVEVSSANGRSTIERIRFFEHELERRDADLARLAAWEASVAGTDDPEVTAARAYAADVFADILAEAMAETARYATRSESLRTGSVALGARRGAIASITAEADEAADDRDAVGDPATGLPAAPVAAVDSGPVPLVQPVTGPNAIHRAAFEAAVRTHAAPVDMVPTILPLDASATSAPKPTTTDGGTADEQLTPAPRSWWSRIVDGLLRIVGRR